MNARRLRRRAPASNPVSGAVVCLADASDRFPFRDDLACGRWVDATPPPAANRCILAALIAGDHLCGVAGLAAGAALDPGRATTWRPSPESRRSPSPAWTTACGSTRWPAGFEPLSSSSGPTV